MAAVWKAPWTALLVVLFTASTHALIIQHNASKGTAVWSTYNGKSYLYVASPTVTRDGAVAACTSLGAALVTIGDAGENTFVGTLLPQTQNTNVWIANEVNDGLYTNFLPGRPSGADVCVRFFSLVWGSYEDSWDDNACSTSLGYVCVQGGGSSPAASGAAAVGDPHLQNIHGERFDLMKPGKHVLINIPRGVGVEKSLLRVQADARRLGGHCADMYFQELNVTGSWAEAKQAGGYHYSVSQGDVETPEWVAFGKVGLKVVHGRTDGGLSYLNVYVKHLGRAGFAVGGLLGEDDHADVITPPEACTKSMSLLEMYDGDRRAPSVLSVAEASLA